MATRSALIVLACFFAPGATLLAQDDQVVDFEEHVVDFEDDVWPLLVSRCQHCHGEDDQEGRLRLDSRAITLAGGISGPAVVPGNASESLLLERILGQGDQEQMPTDDVPLNEEEIELIRQWIDSGADWPRHVGVQSAEVDLHWAYVAPQRPELPAADADWSRNAIDHFVWNRLEEQGFSPSAEASREQLLRRVYLDLIGLPPSIEEIDAFLADDSDDAYEKVVQSLLDSPRYGEKWARQWLDLARFADSNGYQRDGFRTMWAYRDWVIHAMNADMPFDQFTIEQLAGDLLENPTQDQLVATGFHRCAPANVEAGTDQEENRVNQIIDRVNTTGTVWLGTSMACVQCHNHKYDPFTQRDYYQLFAFFNNTPIETKTRGEGDIAAIDFTGAPNVAVRGQPGQQTQASHSARLIQNLREERQQQRTLAMAGYEAWQQEMLEGTNSRSLPERLAGILATDQDERSRRDSRSLEEYYLGQQTAYVEVTEALENAEAESNTNRRNSSLVMQELEEPRETFVLTRGNFLSPAERVFPSTPAILPPMEDGLPTNRLGLAQWIVSRENPLTARVVVNRWWAEIFGGGLVKSLEDFGSQSEPPTHPQLLDWLAVQLMEEGWSMKSIHRLIVTSATYRQTSAISPEAFEADPANQWYARGPRNRLPAEAIRDCALMVAGQISFEMGGASIRPPQPPNVWRVGGSVNNNYRVTEGSRRYRRGIYVVWRRSAPYPSFVNFDAPNRTACVTQRSRTNTPLQALTLMNDPVYVEAAGALAARMVEEVPEGEFRERLEYGFRLCLTRRPTEREISIFESAYLRELQRRNQDEAAAWHYVATILMNLDETITKN